MFNIKTIITVGFATIGAIVVFALIQHFAPLWIWASLVGIGFLSYLLICAYEPKKKPKYWLLSYEYVDENGEMRRTINLLEGYSKPFLKKRDVDNLHNWVRFSITEITDETAELIQEKINQQEQQDNESKD